MQRMYRILGYPAPTPTDEKADPPAYGSVYAWENFPNGVQPVHCTDRKNGTEWKGIVSNVSLCGRHPTDILLTFYETTVRFSHGWGIAAYHLAPDADGSEVDISSEGTHRHFVRGYKWADPVEVTQKVADACTWEMHAHDIRTDGECTACIFQFVWETMRHHLETEPCTTCMAEWEDAREKVQRRARAEAERLKGKQRADAFERHQRKPPAYEAQ